MITLVTAQNVPRDINELAKLTTTARYRICLSLNMWNGDTRAESAFLARDANGQANDLLLALAQYDANNGQVPAAQQQQVQQQPAFQPPAALPPQQLQSSPQPVAFQPPQPLRQPSTVTDPTNGGAVRQPQAHIQAPVQAPIQTPQHQLQQLQPQPGAGAQLLAAVGSLHEQITNLVGVVEDEVAGQGDLEDVRNIILGMARTQRSLAVIVLLVAEQQLGFSGESLQNLIVAKLKDDSLKAFIGEEDDFEGKE